jgi:hypothetical protein
LIQAPDLPFQILAIKNNGRGSQFGERGFFGLFLTGESQKEDKENHKKELQKL